jgi:RNA polymerase sigma-70 factor (ECF subfamily)
MTYTLDVWVIQPAAASDATRQWDAMQRYARGDNAAFREVYEQLAPPLHRFCLRLCASAPEADDLLQETLLKLHRARGTYRAQLNPLHWAYAIARSAYIDRLRRKKSRPATVPETAAHSEPAQPGTGPEAELHALQLRDAVLAVLSAQAEPSRTAYILVRLEGVSVNEAAGVLGATADAVKQRVHRVAEALRIALQNKGLDADV